MNIFLKKNYNSSPVNWLMLLNSAEIRHKNVFCKQYCNLYDYAANNPVRYIDPDGREDDDNNVILKPLYNLENKTQKSSLKGDIQVLKDNFDLLYNDLFDNNIKGNYKFAAKQHLGLNLSNPQDLKILKDGLSSLKGAVDQLDISDINFVAKNKQHPEYAMFVNKNDKTHSINVTDLSSYHQDVGLFHELTHFSDVLDTIDNYDWGGGIPPEIPSSERLKTAQSWTLFYMSCFGR